MGFSEEVWLQSAIGLGSKFGLQCLNYALLQFKNTQIDCDVHKNSREAGTLPQDDLDIPCDEEKPDEDPDLAYRPYEDLWPLPEVFLGLFFPAVYAKEDWKTIASKENSAE